MIQKIHASANILYKRLLAYNSPYFKKYNVSNKADRLRLLSRVYIDQELELTFFRVPKAANSSLIASIYKHKFGAAADGKALKLFKESDGMASNIHPKTMQHALDNYRKVAIVRNPYTRFLSCYYEKMQKAKYIRQVNLFLGKDINNPVSIDTFLDYLEAGEEKIFENVHWTPQSVLVPAPTNEIDYLIKFERLSKDLPKALQSLGLGEDSLQTFTSHRTNSDKRFGELYSSQVNRIRKLYEPDFDKFRYKSHNY